MAWLDGNAKAVKVLIINDFRNNINGSQVEDPYKLNFPCLCVSVAKNKVKYFNGQVSAFRYHENRCATSYSYRIEMNDTFVGFCHSEE